MPAATVEAVNIAPSQNVFSRKRMLQQQESLGLSREAVVEAERKTMAAESQLIPTQNTLREEVWEGGYDSDTTLASASNIKVVYNPSKNSARPI